MASLAEARNTAVSSQGSRDNPLTDTSVMASAATITPTMPVTKVSGTAAIATITLPYPDFQGRITLIPTGIFTWTTGGNIALAGTAVVNKALDMIWDPLAAKWVPSYIA